MWTCLYGFVLDILCVKYIIFTLNCDMRNMSKFSIFSVIPSQNKIFRFTNSEFRPLDTKFRPKSPKFRRYTSEFRFLNSNSLSVRKQRNSAKFRPKFRFRQLPGFHRKTKWLTLLVLRRCVFHVLVVDGWCVLLNFMAKFATRHS